MGEFSKLEKHEKENWFEIKHPYLFIYICCFELFHSDVTNGIDQQATNSLSTAINKRPKVKIVNRNYYVNIFNKKKWARNKRVYDTPFDISREIKIRTQITYQLTR